MRELGCRWHPGLTVGEEEVLATMAGTRLRYGRSYSRSMIRSLPGQVVSLRAADSAGASCA